ncbi:hypothetical protein PDESU_00775 [Pontiella desulfatans]|uniref:Acetyl xylan esterase domain-containing protein n=1 Tax=Pontiella desulfatans TaxID=2750659 RepID=A0A6C2TXH9_PONDE|nr:acetylxylan esterase [Pontiella desulfatans]VGO12224.1 hypothetical protein PDESU_00775 [Pontiella desulfatans]
MKKKSVVAAFCAALAIGVYADPDWDAVVALGDLTNAPSVYTTNGVVTNVNCVGSIQSMMYESVEYTGKTTRVWAYIGMPAGASAENPVPAVVLVHGGGGTAFSDWVQHWNDRGYAAIAMDNEGRMVDPATGEKFVQPWGGPQRTGIYDDMAKPIGDHFMYHATASAIVANSLIRSLPEVDADKIGIMGVSWGGVITSTTIGLDDRFAFAIPTYGCGHLYDAMSHWGGALIDNETYKTVWDPFLRLDQATMPVLWYSWPGDYHFPLDSQGASYMAAAGERMVSLVPGMNHSHGSAWFRPESYDFADSIISDGTGWCVQQSLSLTGSDVEAVFATTRSLKTATLLFATETGATTSLDWTETNVTSMVESPAGIWTIMAQLPEGTTGWYIKTTAAANVSGYRGEDVVAGSDYQEIIEFELPSGGFSHLHPLGDTLSTGTIEIGFFAPSTLEIVDIVATNESHPGALTYTVDFPWQLREPELLELQFDNSVAGLTEGQSATGTLVFVRENMDGSREQVELPYAVTTRDALTIIYEVTTNWASQTPFVIDDVLIRSNAVVSLDADSEVNQLTIDDGSLLINGVHSLATVAGLSLNGAGNLIVESGSLSVGGSTISSLELIEISGGAVNFGTGHCQFGKGGPCEVRVIGDDASISMAILNQQNATGSQGTFRFVLDESGVSPIEMSSYMHLAEATIIVDGSAYMGGSSTSVLFSASNIQTLADPNNISMTGFEENAFTASVVQDTDLDEVRLIITAQPREVQLIGRDDFDGDTRYESRTITGANNSDNTLWQIVNRETVATDEVIDTSVEAGGAVALNSGDTLGFLGTNKTDNIFGMYRAGASRTLVYTFDISGAEELTLEMDWACSGDMADKNTSVSCSIDGGATQTVFDVGTSGVNWNETFDNGTVIDRNRSASVTTNGVAALHLTDEFQTYTMSVAGTGSNLTVWIVMDNTVGGFGGFGLDNVTLNGTVIALDGFEAWMSGYSLSGTNATESANPDGDRYTNYEEYIAGLNPEVADAFLISGLTDGERLEWDAASGRVYNVYWSSNLVDGFSLIHSNAPGGAFIDAGRTANPAGFYRISVELAP